MRRAAMYGMIGALSLTFGTIVIPSENFVRQNNRGVQESVIPTVSKETKEETVKDVPKTKVADTQNEADSTNAANTAAVNADGAYVCPHTDGNHPSNCPNWTGSQGNSGGSGNSASQGWGNGRHHGGGHHGGGHH